nr:transmembrane protein 273 isoform X2 [Kogia breviceps]
MVWSLTMDDGAAQVLATGQPAEAKIDIQYAIIGIAVGFAISASFLALKICIIRKHLFDNDSSEQRSTNVGFNGKEMMLSPISAFA